MPNATNPTNPLKNVLHFLMADPLVGVRDSFSYSTSSYQWVTTDDPPRELPVPSPSNKQEAPYLT